MVVRMDALRVDLSPHRSSRKGVPIDLVVLHATAGATLEGAVAWFKNPQSKVSAHYVIGKDGQVVEMVPLDLQAWHAGRCRMKIDGKIVRNINSRSIGIELVNLNNGVDPYPPQQLNALKRVLAELKLRIPTLRFLVGHKEVAYPPGRKTDPQGLDLEELRNWWKNEL